MSSHGNLSLPSSLQEAKIICLPDSFYYIAEFITQEEGRVLLDKVRMETSRSSRTFLRIRHLR